MTQDEGRPSKQKLRSLRMGSKSDCTHLLISSKIGMHWEFTTDAFGNDLPWRYLDEDDFYDENDNFIGAPCPRI